MRIKNPKFAKTSPTRTRQQVDACFDELVGVAVVDFDAIRSHFGKTVEQWPDGVVHQMMIDVGYGDQIGAG